MIRFLISQMQQRAAMARHPERLLRDIGVDVGEIDRWRLIPAPRANGADASRYMVMAPLRS